MRPTIRNSKGQEILLNDMEQRICNINQKMVNDLGYDIDITTLTTIMKKVTEQKFFEIAPADYLPVRVGEGAWSQVLLTYRSYALADDFSTGILNTGGNSDRLAAGDAGVDSVPVVVKNWAKSIGWSLIDLQQAAKAGNWDLITAKEIARKTNWDLGIQKVAFQGLSGDSSCLGLYSQSGVTTNTTIIPQPLSTLSPGDLKAFLSSILNAYRSNAQRTAWPTHFILPESDYLGLVGQASAEFPIKSTLEVLEDAFKVAVKNPNFKILPCAYAEADQFNDSKLHYVLLNYDETSLRMDIPVDYTNTLANSINSFQFQNVGYGQFTGVMAYRPRELFYMTCSPIS